jgi:hypothetical protein
MVQRGELKGGPDYCTLIADGDDWEDDNVVRFTGDEAARHVMLDLLVRPPGQIRLAWLAGQPAGWQPMCLQACCQLRLLVATRGAAQAGGSNPLGGTNGWT